MIRRAIFLLLATTALAGAAEPTWTWRHHRLPRVLAVQGLWHEQFHLAAGLGEAGGAELHEAPQYHGARSSGLHYLKGEGAYGLPRRAEDLYDYDLLVLTNVAARCFSEEQVRLVSDFVRHGGGLLLLGGYWTLDKGGMHGTALEAILPVTVAADTRRLPHRREGIPLTPQADHPVHAGIDWSGGPKLFFHNCVALKPDAVVVVAADEAPILVLGSHGRGRTAVFAGAVNGVAPPDATAFWEWDEWPILLGRTIEWLWAPRRQSRPTAPPSSPATAAGLSDDERDLLLMAEGKEREQLIAKAAVNCDPATAKELLGLLTDGEELAMESELAIIKAIAPHAKPAWAKPLLELKDRMDPVFRGAWLELLGGTRSPEVLAFLVKETRARDLTVRRAALGGLAFLGSPRALPALDRLRAKAPAIDREALADHYAYDKALPDPAVLEVDVLLAGYRSGAPGGAQAVLDVYDRYRFDAGYVAAVLRAPGPGPGDKQGERQRATMRARRGFLQQQLRRIERLFPPVPEGSEKDFIDAARVEARPHCLRLLYRAVETSVRPANAMRFVGLCLAREPGLARLATATIVDLAPGPAGPAIAAGIANEWPRAKADRRQRLLRLARLLPATDRKKIVDLAPNADN